MQSSCLPVCAAALHGCGGRPLRMCSAAQRACGGAQHAQWLGSFTVQLHSYATDPPASCAHWCPARRRVGGGQGAHAAGAQALRVWLGPYWTRRPLQRRAGRSSARSSCLIGLPCTCNAAMMADALFTPGSPASLQNRAISLGTRALAQAQAPGAAATCSIVKLSASLELSDRSPRSNSAVIQGTTPLLVLVDAGTVTARLCSHWGLWTRSRTADRIRAQGPDGSVSAGGSLCVLFAALPAGGSQCLGRHTHGQRKAVAAMAVAGGLVLVARAPQCATALPHSNVHLA